MKLHRKSLDSLYNPYRFTTTAGLAAPTRGIPRLTAGHCLRVRFYWMIILQNWTRIGNPQMRSESKYPDLSQCQICREIPERAHAYSKYGHDDDIAEWPAAIDELVLFNHENVQNSDRHQIRRCPLCAVFYVYDYEYEYLTNGSEDSYELRRLTWTQARNYLSEAEYAIRMEQARAGLESGSAAVRRFSARCVAESALSPIDEEGLRGLLQSNDQEIQLGTMQILYAALFPDLPGRRDAGTGELVERLREPIAEIAARAGEPAKLAARLLPTIRG